jgi:hypothetical protein
MQDARHTWQQVTFDTQSIADNCKNLKYGQSRDVAFGTLGTADNPTQLWPPPSTMEARKPKEMFSTALLYIATRILDHLLNEGDTGQPSGPVVE